MHNRDHSLAVQSVSMPMSFQQPVRPSFAVFAHSTGQTVNSQLGNKASKRRNRPQSVTSRLEITLPNPLRHERPKLPRFKFPISTPSPPPISDTSSFTACTSWKSPLPPFPNSLHQSPSFLGRPFLALASRWL